MKKWRIFDDPEFYLGWENFAKLLFEKYFNNFSLSSLTEKEGGYLTIEASYKGLKFIFIFQCHMYKIYFTYKNKDYSLMKFKRNYPDDSVFKKDLEIAEELRKKYTLMIELNAENKGIIEECFKSSYCFINKIKSEFLNE
jgi:hypothetical protein